MEPRERPSFEGLSAGRYGSLAAAAVTDTRHATAEHITAEVITAKENGRRVENLVRLVPPKSYPLPCAVGRCRQQVGTITSAVGSRHRL
jgi:hypothetical protein